MTLNTKGGHEELNETGQFLKRHGCSIQTVYPAEFVAMFCVHVCVSCSVVSDSLRSHRL